MYNLDTKSMNKLNMKYIQCNRDESHQPSDNDLKKYNIRHIDNTTKLFCMIKILFIMD